MSLQPPPLETLPDDLRNRLETARLTNNDARFLEAIVNAPHMATFYFDAFYRDIFFKGVAPVRVKELVRLRLSQLHGCAF